MTELLVLVALVGTGLLVLAPFGRGIPPVAYGALSFPIGASVFAIVGLGWVVVFGAADPAPMLAVTVGLGFARFLVGVAMGQVSVDTWKPALWTLGAAVIVATVFQAVHLSRLTIDSIRYVLASVDVQESIEAVHNTDLLKRQIGLPLWHTLAGLGDGRFMATLGPAFGISGTVLFGWFVHARTAVVEARTRRILVVGAIGLVLASNRWVYDFFYINTHVAVGTLMFVGVAGLWLAIVEDDPSWAHPAGMALAVTGMLRAESPLVIALVLVLAAPYLRGWEMRVAAVLPTIGVAVGWYALVLWNEAAGGSEIALDAPVLMGLVAMLVASTFVVITGLRPIRPLAALGARLVIPVLVVGLVVLTALEPIYGWRSLKATVLNVGFRGVWMFTWTVLVPLLVAALVIQRIRVGEVWSRFIIGFGLLYFMLPYLRDGSYRVGTGDSGNRILAHVLLIAVAFVVLAVVSRIDATGDVAREG